MKRWHVVYTQPRNEALAFEHLERQGFEVFLPRYLRRRSHARVVDMVPAPLFPRYLFAAFDDRATGWCVIRSTRGVVDLVRSGDGLAWVSEIVIDELRRRRDKRGFVLLARELDLGPGQHIRIDFGAFAGCNAIFDAETDHDRVRVLLDLLGREVAVEVPVAAVLPAE
jgi:transcriptional antiterminator RfaH